MIGLLQATYKLANNVKIISFRDADTILAICAIVVSIVGLGISVYFNRKTFRHRQTHDKLTTEPHLALRNDLTEMKGISLILKNCGYGSAVIKEINFRYGGRKYRQIDDLYFENFKKLKGFVEESVFYVFDENEVLGSEETLELSKLIIKKGFDYKSFIEFLKEVTVEVNYTNIYNDERFFKRALINQQAHQ